MNQIMTPGQLTAAGARLGYPGALGKIRAGMSERERAHQDRCQMTGCQGCIAAVTRALASLDS